MSHKSANPAPLLRRSYLVALGFIALFSAPFVFKEQGPRLWNRVRPVLFGETDAVITAPPVAPTDGTALALRNMCTFLFELAEKGGGEKLSRVPDCLLCEKTPCVCADFCPFCRKRYDHCDCSICPVCHRKMGVCICGGVVVANVPPVKRIVWDLPIHSVSYEREGWKAWIGANPIMKGTHIAMSDIPGGPCGYRVLSVSRYCLWALALRDDGDLRATAPEFLWPDFHAVKLMQVQGSNRPVGLALPDDRILAINRSLRFSRTESSLSLERLWPRGGEFALRMADGKELARMICVLPAR